MARQSGWMRSLLAVLGIARRTTEPLVAAVARAAAITDPARTAAMLGRLSRVPLLRAQLRRLAAAAEPRQVLLL